ncbi:BZ3500_MvSof-1268-A1-R1_Chr1-3g02361 [Microbotryum saponariae]|uniref:BZ3500_MvSof-1268-A1-R1_Chr1-3g02361 protein n=1 Tax=Microbotryum saponariae TaxID=289078 RepID=A0A2X0KH03_9BASI|nr:BZ3500_MvSof-1268-A1-R1_Chr1-3g02361 [Microbotryum saponariae]SCZ96107.1 BZ3501_MvSof-1269-A2-R1_Chr1-3g01964 [Microbotryum saponariae]
MGRRSRILSVRLWLALASLGMMASLPTIVSSSGLLKYTPSSCLPKDTLAAPDSQQLKMTALYAQFDQGQTFAGQKANGYNLGATGQYPVFDKDGARYTSTTGTLLRVVLVGTTQALAQGYSNTTTYLSTVDIDANVLSFPIYSNQSALCSGIRTSAGANSTTGSGCPYQGDIALGFSIVLGDSYAATTITSKLIVLDPSVPAKHLACYDLEFTPFYPKYFVYPLVLYFVIALLSLYLVLYVIARLNAAYTAWLQDNETHLASSLTLKISSHTGTLSRRKMWGAIWFNAWAGREVVASGSLRRFGTAELREVLVTIQWASLVGTIAVNWPGFAYPIFAQTAWTTLVYNSTLSFTSPPPSILPNNIEKPPLFSTQMGDLNSPLYLDDSLPNVLLDVEGSPQGLARWARAIGVRPEDVWSICAFTFFIICAAIVGAHLLFFLFDTAIDTFLPSRYSKRRVMRDGLPALTKDGEAREGEQHHYNDLGHEYGHVRGNSSSNRPSSAMSAREPSSRSSRHPLVADTDVVGDEVFLRDEEMTRPEDVVPSWRLHLALLHGNIVRAVMFFHLPLSIFSVYVLAHRSEIESSKTYSLAGATFAIVCFIFPLVLLARIYYSDLRTLYTSLTHLLELGPLYNTYADECTMFAGMRLGTNIVLAIVIGAVQGVGTAQAAVVLAVEVADTLVTSLWLPWGDNAAMGPLAFLLSLARVVIAVLLVVISPTVAVSIQARSWITYIIFLVQAIVGLMLLWVLVFKFFELIVRLVGRVPFDESRSPRAGGLFGTLRKWDRGAAGGGPTARGRRKKRKGSERRAAAREAATGERRRPERRDSPRDSRRLNRQSMETRSVLAANRASHRGSRYDDDAAYIMSPMSSGPWSQTGSTHSSEVIKPGAYSNKGGPVLRSGPNWGEATVVPATNASVMSVSTASSGFQRVGGGRATYTNPYQLATVELDNSNQYPPYPSSSADVYSVKAPGNPRRLSQSAVIEMASATALSNEEEVLSSTSTITGNGSNRQARRSSAPLALPPSSSTLLSNAVPRYDAPDKTRQGQRRSSRPISSGGTPAKKTGGTGLFGRFRRTQPRPSTSDYSDDSDDFTDDEEDDDEVSRGKRPAGRLKGLFATRFAKKADQGKKQQGAERHQAEEVEQLAPAVAPEQAGFSVVRKPRPRPPVTAASTPTTKSESTEASERTTSSDSARKDADEPNRPT